MSSDHVFQLYRKAMEAAGGTFKFGDSTNAILVKWCRAVDGTPRFLDNKHDLLRKICLALGKNPKSGDTFNDFLQKIAGLKPGNSEWDCLNHIVHGGPTSLDAPVALPATLLLFGNFRCNWEAVTGAASYRLDVATDSGFTSAYNGLTDVVVVAPTVSYTSSIGASPGTLYYRVRAVNGAIVSANSNVISFTIL